MNDDNIAIRLKFLIEKLRTSSSQFADECKIPRPTFSQILNGRNKKISNQIISQIHKAYPNVSVNWLLFNEGDPFLGVPEEVANGITNDDQQISSNSLKNDSSLQSSLPASSSSPVTMDLLGENPSQNLKSRPITQTQDENRKENGLNPEESHSQSPINKDLTSLIENPELIVELAKIQPRQRKVVSVTIYYDDSTFETFRPA